MISDIWIIIDSCHFKSLSLKKKCLSSFDEILSNSNCFLLLKNAIKPKICQAEIYWLSRGRGDLAMSIIIDYRLILPDLLAEQLPSATSTLLSTAVMMPGRFSVYSECSCLPCGFFHSAKHIFFWGQRIKSGIGKSSLLVLEAF